MDEQLAAMQARIQPFFAGTLGIRLTSMANDRVTAELDVRDELCTVPGVCHGGALMAFADQLGDLLVVVALVPLHGDEVAEAGVVVERADPGHV